jgi:hypothetical protein
MAADSPPDFAIEAARNGGKVPRGGYWVVVFDQGLELVARGRHYAAPEEH